MQAAARTHATKQRTTHLGGHGQRSKKIDYHVETACRGKQLYYLVGHASVSQRLHPVDAPSKLHQTDCGTMPELGSGVNEPCDLIRLSLSERVLVKLRGDRERRGVLHAYDGHMNLIMGDVEEVLYDVEVAEDTGAETIKVRASDFVECSPQKGREAE